ncbi:MAG: 3'-5' exonuclease [Flammeovirgaceae bacterium]|nr:3'-5' exonuclease [Flammeovirgaceae bacterium]
MNSDLKDILFLDIETVAISDNYNTLDERLKVQWSRKAGFFKQRDELTTDEQLFHQRAGIYAEFGKVVCIAVAKFYENESHELCIKTKYFADDNEYQVLSHFRQLVEKKDLSNLKLCAHNGKEFDFPYLSRRMLINGIPLPAVLSLSGKKSWEIPHLDTMELWKFGDYKHYTSLDLLTALFKIPSSKGSMDGSKVNEVYYKEKNLNKISEYCVADVVAVAQLYLRLKGEPIVDPQKIISSNEQEKI